MARSRNLLITLLAFMTFSLLPASAQKRFVKGHIMIPKSSVAQPSTSGRVFHTNIQVFMPDTGRPLVGPPFPGFGFETPASLGCVYGLTRRTPGCNPNVAIANPTGGKGAIAIVDAFDDPNAAADLAFFSAQFGLAPANLKVVYATGTQPALDPTGGWELEESLDIEWAHAMAPKAKIFLVEAASNMGDNLFVAEQVASSLVAAAGGGEVSNSWGGEESADEVTADPLFVMPGVVFFASTGDAPGTSYPSTSPNVVAAGGTTTARSPFTGDFLYELPWTEAGGGASDFEPRPHYQNGVARVVGNARGTPDVSFDSNPDTGVWVWDSNLFQGAAGGWFVVGGTSVASPSLAGIVNSAEHLFHSSDAELSVMYSNARNPFEFHDVQFGFCGPYAGFLAERGWDFCSGIGSMNGKHGK
jgi:kumamolisin